MMLALADGRPTRAAPRRQASCPDCAGPMLAKCGPIVRWHWAHRPGADCEHGGQAGGRDWHLLWKERFYEAGCRSRSRSSAAGFATGPTWFLPAAASSSCSTAISTTSTPSGTGSRSTATWCGSTTPPASGTGCSDTASSLGSTGPRRPRRQRLDGDEASFPLGHIRQDHARPLAAPPLGITTTPSTGCAGCRTCPRGAYGGFTKRIDAADLAPRMIAAATRHAGTIRYPGPILSNGIGR